MSATKAVLLSIGLYLLACICPALTYHVREDLGRGGSVWGGYRSDRGYQLLFAGLFFGWMRLNLTGWVNPLLWTSWICLARKSFVPARMLSLIALIWSIETLQLAVQPMIWDEGATQKGFLVAPHVGFILWIASMAVVFLVSSNRLKQQRATA